MSTMSVDKSDLEHRLIMALRQYGISNTLFRNAVASRLGLNVTDMECLGLLFHKGIATPTELANHTGLSSGSTTAMLDRLEKAQLIVRKPNPHDRRGVLIAVDKAGSARVAPLFAGARNAQNKLVASYSEKDLQLLTEFFEKFTAMYEEQRKDLIQLRHERNRSKSPAS
jgi:DNA-binding MarR family transcriptional regulator